MELNELNTSCSKASNVFKKIADDLEVSSTELTMNLNMKSFEFVVLMKLGKSFNRTFFIPGNSIGVSKYPFVIQLASDQ